MPYGYLREYRIVLTLYTLLFYPGSPYNNYVPPNREQMQGEVLLLQAPVNNRIGVAIVGCTTMDVILCINIISIIHSQTHLFPGDLIMI